MLTPTGMGGTVTLDTAGVRLVVMMGRLPVAVEEEAAPVLAAPVALPTPEKVPAVKPVVASAAGPASVEEVEAVAAALAAPPVR